MCPRREIATVPSTISAAAGSREAGRQRPGPNNTDNVQHSESARVQINERDSARSVRYTERGTTPVLRKIAFSDDSM
jgi:hypothetical protein